MGFNSGFKGLNVLHSQSVSCMYFHKKGQFVLFMYNYLGKVCKLSVLQAWTGPCRSMHFLDSRHIKVVRLSALRTGLLYA